jgi:hypothetical protein
MGPEVNSFEIFHKAGTDYPNKEILKDARMF